MMNLHLHVVTTFMTGVCEVNASLCDTVVHGPFLRFRHGDFTRSIAAAILFVPGADITNAAGATVALQCASEREVAVIPALATVEVPAPKAAARWQSW
ncbi:hypothetical protein LSAT2_023724 [Lamellibrachia satsuma]|nr:hypothetical protein LSAT2_023724 [Lamellibrachia satsuma]